MKVVIVRTDGSVEYVDCVNPPFLIEGLLVEKIDLNKEVTMFHDDLAEAREKKENHWATAIVEELTGSFVPIFGDVAITGYSLIGVA
jgi:pyrimidine operon attenuation protein/uracil phosphoribosyltransferase